MDSADKQLLELIKIAIWPQYENRVDGIINYEWPEIYQKAEMQSVVGLSLMAVEKLYKENSNNRPGFNELMLWIAQTERQKSIYKKHVEILGQVHQLLVKSNIEHVFMKGLICGMRYPNPSLRTCGDIDFVVAKNDFKKTLSILEEIGKVDCDLVHEHHGMADVDGVVIEPHYKVHNYQKIKHDKVMQAIFKEIFPKHLEEIEVDGTKVPVFPVTFESMFLISHMVNHVYEEGLGLRQIIDYALLLNQKGAEIDWEKHDDYLKGMGMKRAHRIFVRVCEKYLGLSSIICGYSYTEKEQRFADKLMDDILRVGNFGRGGYVFQYDSLRDVLQNYLWVMKRSLRLGWLCPSEAYMWPVCKFNRYFSKKFNPSIYK